MINSALGANTAIDYASLLASGVYYGRRAPAAKSTLLALGS